MVFKTIVRRLIVLCLVCISLRAVAADTDPVPHSNPNPPPAEELNAADGVNAVKEQEVRQREAVEVLNALNPMSTEYGKPIQGAEYGQPTRIEDGPFKELYQLLSNPAAQKVLRFFRQPEFVEGATEIIQHPRRGYLIYGEIAVVLLVLMLRIWRRAKAKNWLGRIWVNVWTFLLGTVLASLVVPVFILGDSYIKVLKGLIETFSGG